MASVSASNVGETTGSTQMPVAHMEGPVGGPGHLVAKGRVLEGTGLPVLPFCPQIPGQKASEHDLASASPWPEVLVAAGCRATTGPAAGGQPHCVPSACFLFSCFLLSHCLVVSVQPEYELH